VKIPICREQVHEVTSSPDFPQGRKEGSFGFTHSFRGEGGGSQAHGAWRFRQIGGRSIASLPFPSFPHSVFPEKRDVILQWMNPTDGGRGEPTCSHGLHPYCTQLLIF